MDKYDFPKLAVYQVQFGRHNGEEAEQRFFGLTEAEGESIFGPDLTNDPVDSAERIERLIKNHAREVEA